MGGRGKNYFKRFRIMSRIMARRTSQEKADRIITEQVFENERFKSNVRETAHKMKITEELAETIIKHHLSYLYGFMINPPKHRRKIILFGFFSLEIVNPLYNKYSYFNLNSYRGYLSKIKRLKNLKS